MAQYIRQELSADVLRSLVKIHVIEWSANDAGVLEWEKTLYDLLKDWEAYGVAVREPDGLYFVKKKRKISMSFLASCSRGRLIFCPARKPDHKLPVRTMLSREERAG